MLDALGLLAERGLELNAIFIGEPEGEVRDLIADRVDKYGIESRVKITGHLPHEEVATTLVTARIGIVPLHDYPKFHKNIACKAFEYMACGMPTISSDLPPQHLFLDEQVGLFYPCGDTVALADRIAELHADPERCETMGACARLSVEERWNGEQDQEKFCDFYDDLLAMPLRGDAA